MKSKATNDHHKCKNIHTNQTIKLLQNIMNEEVFLDFSANRHNAVLIQKDYVILKFLQ